MKVIIAGGRNYKFTQLDLDTLDTLFKQYLSTHLVTGKCSGVDAEGEKWARSIGLHIKPFPADWNKYFKAAGPIRNREMAKYAQAVILFPGDDGTQSMYKEAVRAGIKIIDLR